tara:strand:- start:152 stop:364 length:213 start_codon:yes stop_codon:yes gene_type:complete
MELSIERERLVLPSPIKRCQLGKLSPSQVFHVWMVRNPRAPMRHNKRGGHQHVRPARRYLPLYMYAVATA